MSHEIDWTRIRGVPWEDDPPDRAELVSEVERLRRLLEDRPADASGQPPAALAAELRRLVGEVAALRSALPPLLVTADVAAEVLGVSLSTVRRMIRAGDLPTRRLGHSVRIDIARCHGVNASEVAELARAARSGRGRVAGE